MDVEIDAILEEGDVEMDGWDIRRGRCINRWINR